MKPVKKNFEKNNILKFLVVFDVYIDIPPKSRVWLVDFGIWGTKTDSLLFDWAELEKESQKLENNEMNFENIQFKYIESQHGIKDNGLGQYKVPIVKLRYES